MNRRDFFAFLRAAPLAAPVLLSQSMKADGVSLDGQELYLGGKKVMQRLADGSIVLGENGNLKLHNSPKLGLEISDISFYSSSFGSNN